MPLSFWFCSLSALHQSCLLLVRCVHGIEAACAILTWPDSHCTKFQFYTIPVCAPTRTSENLTSQASSRQKINPHLQTSL